jgi:hypothetical protein
MDGNAAAAAEVVDAYVSVSFSAVIPSPLPHTVRLATVLALALS